jgi:hypothetical protein
LTELDEIDDFLDRIEVDIIRGMDFDELLKDVLANTARAKFKPTEKQLFYLKAAARRKGVQVDEPTGEKLVQAKIARETTKRGKPTVFLKIEQKTQTSRGMTTREVHAFQTSKGKLRYKDPKTGKFVKKPSWVD